MRTLFLALLLASAAYGQQTYPDAEYKPWRGDYGLLRRQSAIKVDTTKIATIYYVDSHADTTGGASTDTTYIVFWHDTIGVLITVSDTSTLHNEIFGRADSSLALYWPDSTALLAYVKSLVALKLAISDTSYLHNQIVLKADSTDNAYRAWVNAAHLENADSAGLAYRAWVTAAFLENADSAGVAYRAWVSGAFATLTALGAKADTSLAFFWPDTTAAFAYLNSLIAAKQAGDATLTDIADGTVAEDLDFTAHPMADNEVASSPTWNARLDTAKITTWPDTVKTLDHSLATNYDLSLKLNITDTTAMGTARTNGLALKLNISDTTAMGTARTNGLATKQNAGTQNPYRANMLTYLRGDGYWNPVMVGVYLVFNLPRNGSNNTIQMNVNAYTKTGNADATDGIGPAITFTSGTTAGNTAGLVPAGYNATYQVTRMDWEPIYRCRFATTSAFRGGAYTIGLTSATLFNASAPNVHAAYARYDSTADNTAFWRMVTIGGTGASAQVTVTTVAVATSTEYELIIFDNAADDSIFFYMGSGGSIPALVASHHTTIPTQSTVIADEIGCRSLVTGTAAAIKWRGSWVIWAD